MKKIAFGFVIAVVAVAVLAAGVRAQAPASSNAGRSAAAAPGTGKPYVVPKTPDGQPDLQGFWSNTTYVPLERPANVTKEFYTPEEAAVIIKNAASRETEQTTPGTVEDVHYDFSQFGLDRSQATRAQNLRTSLIVDPP